MRPERAGKFSRVTEPEEPGPKVGSDVKQGDSFRSLLMFSVK